MPKKFQFHVDEKFMATLTHLAERTKKEKADVIRDALKHYENSLNEWVSRQNIPPPD